MTHSRWKLVFRTFVMCKILVSRNHKVYFCRKTQRIRENVFCSVQICENLASGKEIGVCLCVQTLYIPQVTNEWHFIDKLFSILNSFAHQNSWWTWTNTKSRITFSNSQKQWYKEVIGESFCAVPRVCQRNACYLKSSLVQRFKTRPPSVWLSGRFLWVLLTDHRNRVLPWRFFVSHH